MDKSLAETNKARSALRHYMALVLHLLPPPDRNQESLHRQAERKTASWCSERNAIANLSQKITIAIP